MNINETALADKIVKYSIKAKRGDKVLILYSCIPQSFLLSLISAVKKVGAYPFLLEENKMAQRIMLDKANEEYINLWADVDLYKFKHMDCTIMAKGEDNMYELSGLNDKYLALYQSIYTRKVHIDCRLKTRWVLLKYPTPSFAQSANMSTQEFEKYFFDVCLMDYKKLNTAMTNLARLMAKTDKVRIVAKGTDLRFSIKGIGSVKCSGEMNIPDGELYTAPVKNSVNGVISFNVPVMQDGERFDNIVLEVKNGKIIKASCQNNTAKLNKILDTDAGSRYFGEFSFGLNPYVTKSINDILFDEKMYGSIHLAVGNSYSDAFNGNTSAIHWDLILNQTLPFGGEIYFDDVLIRKNGEFILPDLVVLNRKNLVQ